MEDIDKIETKTQAKRVKTLLKKYKKLLGKHYETIDFEEPILFLRRRSGRIEFYEKATKGHFEYIHSDGEIRYLNILGNPDIFEYGNKKFRGYIFDEDHPFKFPQKPLITAENYTMAMEKTNNDLRKWKTEQLKATSNLWWSILSGIALIIMAIVAYVMLKPQNTPQAIATAAPIAKTATTAITNATTGITQVTVF